MVGNASDVRAEVRRDGADREKARRGIPGQSGARPGLMSLNKTLDRLFDEIRREAKRNPDFADRLDAVLRLHDSRRDVADDVVEEVAQSSPASGGGGEAAQLSDISA